MEKFSQVSAKISGFDQFEINKKIEKLGASNEMPIVIKEIEADSNDGKKWFIINFFIKKSCEES